MPHTSMCQVDTGLPPRDFKSHSLTSGNGVVKDSFGILTNWLLQLIHPKMSAYTLVSVKERVFTLFYTVLHTLLYNSVYTLLKNITGRTGWKEVSWRILLAIAVISVYRRRHLLPGFWASLVEACHILFAQPDQLELEYYRVKAT